MEGGSKASEKDEMIKSWDDSSTSKYKKKLNKVATGRKYLNRSNGSSFINGGLDCGEDASDREMKMRLSRLNKKSIDSESETSDDPDRSSEDSKGGSDSTSSDAESDSTEGRTGQSRGDRYFKLDEGLDSMTEDREWGARMTKASLVPPVTRKYEVIDEYVIVADEEEVKRKMQVSLPDDYVEKLNAQKNGTEESDMELPEVKDYKPRKQLGGAVIEQEVYGIDPYTHNLLLDSMPEELDWPLLEKHLFIEDVLLRTLNKQVRHFTGSGNTPMIFALRPVVEEIRKAAEENGDSKTMRMCQGILKAIDSRPDDKYVAYRKVRACNSLLQELKPISFSPFLMCCYGCLATHRLLILLLFCNCLWDDINQGLGVVCNEEEGFGEEDFVVEFLGEVWFIFVYWRLF